MVSDTFSERSTATPEPGEPLTIEAFEQIMDSLPLPTIHPAGEPIVLTEHEYAEYLATGSVLIHWSDGKASRILSQEVRDRVLKMLEDME